MWRTFDYDQAFIAVKLLFWAGIHSERAFIRVNTTSLCDSLISGKEISKKITYRLLAQVFFP